MTEFNEAGFEIIDDEELIEYVGKELYTGILHGGNEREWESDSWRGLYLNGAVDAIRAYRKYERGNA